MPDVIPLTKTLRKKKAQQKKKHSTMCSRGFHKWQIDKESIFDTKVGQLVTVLRCVHCGEIKHNLI